MADNKLYYGDNLDILRRYVADESVALVYLDPPFKSNQDYNVLFKERLVLRSEGASLLRRVANGSRSAAQVKAGHVTVAHIRDLRGVIERENAQIGCLICLEEPTQPMRAEAAEAGFYQHPLGTGMYPCLQILTIKELLEGNKLDLPESRIDVTFKKAPRAKPKQRTLGETENP